ncbi:MAG: hypothetical protein RLZZ367_472 [Bacteroidota bacterium]|jgi:hypothetical protein
MNIVTATWQANWHELDQSIKCGVTDDWWLVKKDKNAIRFHTGLDNKEWLWVLNGEILSITHKTLGAINEIDCRGLTYRITLASGKYIQVEAEETPGMIEKEFSTHIEDFDTCNFEFLVEIKLSESGFTGF